MKRTVKLLTGLLATALALGIATGAGAAPTQGALTPQVGPYWTVASDGGVFTSGGAQFYGSMGGKALNAPMVGISATPSGHGYWTVASDGGVFSYGDSQFYGSMGGKALNKPMVGMASTISGHGYWTVASGGGVFSYGDAQFYGSTGSLSLHAPVVGMAVTASGRGYYLVTSDGGVFAFGDAQFYGSMGGKTLNAPIVGMAVSENGYYLVGSDGGVFSYGDAQFYGSAAGAGSAIVGIASTTNHGGYWLARQQGSTQGYGDATGQGAMTLNAPIVGITSIPGFKPTGISGNYTTPSNTALHVGAPGVLNGAHSSTGTAMTAVLDKAGSGTVTLNSDGSFDYTPARNFVGTDTFYFHIEDAYQSSDSIAVNVNVVAQKPVANGESYNLYPNSTLSVDSNAGVLSNDSDPQGSALTAVLATDVAHGTLSLSANGSFTYTPTPNFVGTDQFTYQASDAYGQSEPATVELDINPLRPVATSDEYFTPSNTPLVEAAPGVLSNDSDPQGAMLSANLVTASTHGSIALQSDGGFTYTPDSNFVGDDQFTYQASDAYSSSDPITVTIHVTAQAPVAAADDYSVFANNSLSQAAPGVLSNDTDPQQTGLTASLVSDVSNGSLTLNSDGSFDYTPTSNFVGDDQFTYQASDAYGSSNVATVTIHVTAQAPYANDDYYTTNQNQELTTDSNSGVLGNDSDPQGLSLSASLVSDVSNGTLVLNSDGSFTYVPNTGFAGSDQFTYSVSNGYQSSSATAYITTNLPSPGAPTVQMLTSTSATVSWDSVAGATSYAVSSNSDFGDQPGCTTGGTSCDITGLVPGNTYYFYVVASNSSVSSQPSDSTSYVVAPDVPTGLGEVSPVGPTSLTLQWDGSQGATSYTVQGAGSGCTVSGTSCTISGLVASTTYDVQVLASNAGGSSSYSDTVTVGTTPTTPSAPTLTQSGSSVVVAWSPGESGVTYQAAASPGSQTCSVVGDVSCTITGLTAGTTYSVTVSATNSYGTTTGPSNSISVAYPAGTILPFTSTDLTRISSVDLVTDSAGNVYSSDYSNNNVYKITPSGAVSTIGNFNGPQGVAVDSLGRVYVAEGSGYIVTRVNLDGTRTTIAGNGTRSYAGAGDGGLATSAALGYPEGIAVDSNFNVYFSDANTCRVREVDTNGIITTVVNTTGSCGTSGDGGTPAAAHIQNPAMMKLTSGGNFYLITQNGVRVFNLQNNTITTLPVGLSFGYGQAYGIAIDSSGDVFLSDPGNKRVLEVTPGGTTTVVAGITGSSGNTGDGGPATSATLSYPWGLATNGSDLYIGDVNNQRIRKVQGPLN